MKKVMRRLNERFHPNDSIGYAYGITTRPTYTFTSQSARAPKRELCRLQHFAVHPVQAQEADGLRQIMVRGRELPVGENSQLPYKLEETLSKRLDADKLIFSPQLNHLQMNALQTAQNSDLIRLQQLYRSIRNLGSIAGQ